MQTIILTLGCLLLVCGFSDALLAPSSSIVRRKLAAQSLRAAADVNAIPDSKRRLQAAHVKIHKNMAPSVVNYVLLVEKVKDLELESCDESFWADQDAAQRKLSEAAKLKCLIARIDNWRKQVDDIQSMLDIAASDTDELGMRITV
jgi:hypothetical protein